MAYGSLTNETTVEHPEEDLLKVDDVVPKTSKLWCMRRSNTLLLLYVPLYCLFIAGGAVIFMQTEGTLEEAFRIRLRDQRAQFLAANPCVSDESVESLISEIVRASQRGVLASRNATGGSNWSFGQSFFFASTIVTTIGYGHVHPLSEGGKSFCIAYALIGIPMTLVLLEALLERLLTPTKYFMATLLSRLGHMYESFTLRVAHLLVICLISLVVVFVIPAAIFASLESGWQYSDAFYYCFISLTTIGLGDYIPGDSPDQPMRMLYKIFITGYLMLGLTVVMLMLRLYRDIPQLNLGLLLLPSSDHQIDTDHPQSNKSKNTELNQCTSNCNYKLQSRNIDSIVVEERNDPSSIELP